MNQRQQAKIMLQQWLIVECIARTDHRYTLHAIDFQHNGRFSWTGWDNIEKLLQFRIPVRCKTGGSRIRHQHCAKIASKAIWLSLDENQYEELEHLFYQPVSRARWKSFLHRLGKDSIPEQVADSLIQ